MSDTTTLSTGATFLWGSLGAVVTFLVVFVLPEAIVAMKGRSTRALSLVNVVAALVVALIFIIVGGVVAVVIGDVTDAKQALTYGLGIEGIIGGTVKGVIPATNA